MTSREMILALGEEINRLKDEVHVFEGLMMEYRTQGANGRYRELPWRQSLERIADEPSQKAITRQRSDELQTAIPVAASESDLIRALHDFYLGS